MLYHTQYRMRLNISYIISVNTNRNKQEKNSTEIVYVQKIVQKSRVAERNNY